MAKSSSRNELLSSEKLALLQSRLKQKGIDTLRESPITQRSGTGPWPLSFAQQRLWFLDQLEPESAAYLIASALQLDGVLDIQILVRSLQELVRRHESLRTTFEEQAGQPVQVIHPVGNFAFSLVELQGLAGDARMKQVRGLAARARRQPCDLRRGPLLRVWLLRVAAEEHVLLVTMHHIITDGWSNEIFFRELTTLYSVFVAGRPSPFIPLPIQYADYALWQRQWLQGSVLERQVAYWRNQLAGVPPLELPTDHSRPSVQTYRGAFITGNLPSLLSDNLQALCQQKQVTLFILLLAAFQVLLARYSGQQDIAVGTPIANRTRDELGGLIGFFVNTLVLRSQMQEELSFTQFLAQVREIALGAYAHQDVPFEHLVEVLQPQRDPSRSPLFQVMFGVQQITASTLAASSTVPTAGLRVHPMPIEHTTTKFDLTLSVVSSPAGLSCNVEYNTDLFEAATIERLLRHWQTLLEHVVATPDAPLAHLSLLRARDVQDVLLLAEGPAVEDTATPWSWLVQVEQQAQQRRDALAVHSPQTSLSYGHLWRRAHQLAHLLRQQSGIGPEQLVAVLVQREAAWLIGLLGVLQAGGTYLPLDPGLPVVRREHLLRQARPRLLLRLSGQAAAEDEEHAPWATTIPQLTLSEVWRQVERGPELAPQECLPQQLAYVIYTSGSTGEPKGVQVPHGGLGNLARQQGEAFGVDQHSRIWQAAVPSFDASVAEIVVSLAQGACLHLSGSQRVMPGPELWRRLREEGITTLTLPPSALAYLPQEPLPELETLISAGEACRIDLVRAWQAGRQVWNAYGPSEATVCASLQRCEGERVPGLGQAIGQVQLYVLDARGELQVRGVPGELAIGGIGLARGYLGQAPETAERFVPHPWSQQEGARLYRTGDRVRWQQDGTLQFLGREDGQVKLRGYRIELGEIEQVLNGYAGVQASVVVVRELQANDQRLLGYVVASHPQEELDIKALRDYVQERLPDYMVPGHIQVLDALPVLPNGKIDRHQLPEPQEASSGIMLQEEPQEEWSPLEELVGQVWSGVLGDEEIGRHDNFFSLGGHSLLATQIIVGIQALLGVELPLQSLFEAPTIAGLAQRVERTLRSGQGSEVPPLLPVARTDMLPLSFAQQRLWLLDQLSGGSVAYLMPGARRVHGALNVTVLAQALKELISRHESLRTTFHMHADQLVQVIHPIGEVHLPLIDLQALGERVRENEVSRLIQQETRQPCDLTQGPLLRVALLRVHDQEHILLITMHHIISDGWSYTIFFDELVALYQAFIIGQPSPLPSLPIQYADFAVWQRNWLQGAVLKQHLDYWKKQLAGATPVMLPTDRPRPEIQSYRGASYSFALPTELSKGLVKLSRQEGVTLFMTLLAAFQTLLYRYTGQTDIVVGTDVANRTPIETEALIGFFINLLALRTNFNGPPIFRSVLHSVRETFIKSYMHQDIPFEMLVEHLRLERKMNYTPLIHVLFVLRNAGKPSTTSASVKLEPVYGNAATVKFDIALFMQERLGRITGSIIYSTDIFDHSTIETMMKRFEVLLWDIINRPDTSVEVLDMDTAVDKEARQQKKTKIGALKTKSLRNVKGKEIDIS